MGVFRLLDAKVTETTGWRAGSGNESEADILKGGMNSALRLGSLAQSLREN